MIIDSLVHAAQYCAIHPRFERAFAFLLEPNNSTLGDGRYDLESNNLFALVFRSQGKTPEQVRFESHRKYYDIQYIVSGIETMAWLPLVNAPEVDIPYDETKDVEFFRGTESQWVTIKQNQFAIFTPSDIHGPGVSAGMVHKIVMKVKI